MNIIFRKFLKLFESLGLGHASCYFMASLLLMLFWPVIILLICIVTSVGVGLHEIVYLFNGANLALYTIIFRLEPASTVYMVSCVIWLLVLILPLVAKKHFSEKWAIRLQGVYSLFQSLFALIIIFGKHY